MGTMWAVAWLWIGRYHMLDDALIHLRYADHLARLGFLSFDGVTRSYGSSSLLYVTLLAALRRVTTWALLPKLLSVVAYVALLAVAAHAAQRSRRAGQWTWMGFVLCLLSPMGIRWLTDGMETSLVVLAAGVLALAIACMAGRKTSAAAYAGFLVLGALLPVLRVELAFLVAMASLTLLLMHSETFTPSLLVRTALADSHLALGAALGLGGVYLAMDALLPNTALAKAHATPLIEQISADARTCAGSLTFGMGLLLVWLVSATWLLMRTRLQRRRAAVAANATLPLQLVLVLSRGQAIQGVRYLLWALAFMIVWNAQMLREVELPRPAASWQRRTALVALAAITVAWTVEGRITWRVIEDRSETFVRLRTAPFSALAGSDGVAGDIGFISYFSGGRICDLAGLVGGRAVAVMTSDERASYCAQRKPAFAFLTTEQAKHFGQHYDLSRYVVCGQYDFTNVSTPDRHYLLVEPPAAASVCGEAHARWGAGDLAASARAADPDRRNN